MSFLFFIFTLLSTELAGGHVEFNHVNISFFFFLLNTNLEASHINIYISSVLYTILAIIQWVMIKKKKKNHYAQNGLTMYCLYQPHRPTGPPTPPPPPPPLAPKTPPQTHYSFKNKFFFFLCFKKK